MLPGSPPPPPNRFCLRSSSCLPASNCPDFATHFEAVLRQESKLTRWCVILTAPPADHYVLNLCSTSRLSYFINMGQCYASVWPCVWVWVCVLEGLAYTVQSRSAVWCLILWFMCLCRVCFSEAQCLAFISHGRRFRNAGQIRAVCTTRAWRTGLCLGEFVF